MLAAQRNAEDKFDLDGYSIDNPNVILDPYDNSPLSALIIFDTIDEVAPKITIVGKDESTSFVHEFEKATKHILPIYGLYPDTNNRVIIEYEDVKETIRIKTKELPEYIAIPSEVYADKEKLGNDLYFFTPSSIGYTMAYDINGDVRWFLSNHALWKIDRLKNGHLLVSTERPINAPYYMTGLYEMDLLGKIYNEYSLPGGYHHDYYEMENANLLVASDEFDSKYATVEDIIVELDRKTGKIVKTFDLKEDLKYGRRTK